MMEIKKKCGIITFHSAYNYGSVLQSFALVKTLENYNIEAEIIDFRHPHTTDLYQWRFWSHYKNWRWNLREILLRGVLRFGRKRELVFEKFINMMLTLSCKVDNKTGIPDKYDILICGSDQIWNPLASGENDPIYYLDFGSTKCKFSYAASSGSREFGQGCMTDMNILLNNLQAIGVREQFMKEYIKREFNLDSTVNPDPTLLCSSEEWAKIEEPYTGIPSEFLLVYTLKSPKDILSFAKEVGNNLKLPIVYICNDRGWGALMHSRMSFSLMDVSPQQFIWLFHHAKFIVTNSFHGNMFSVIFRKNFINYTVSDNDTRIYTLHDTIGLGKSRLVEKFSEFQKMNSVIDYDSINMLINEYRELGLDYICRNVAKA